MARQFRLITYNLDLSAFEKPPERTVRQFLEEVQQEKPDVVVVQGGHRLVYEHLFREMLRMGLKRYVPEEFKDSCGGRFTEVVFTHLRVKKVVFVPFYNTGEGAGLTVCQLEIDPEDEAKDVWIATALLETAPERGYNKRKQIEHVNTRFQKTPRVIFAGDTNILSYQTTLDAPPGWLDAWKEFGRASNEFTYDHSRNSLACSPCKDRRDRVWYRGIECTTFDLLGTKRPSPTSSHFGIVCEFAGVFPEKENAQPF